MMWFLFFKHGKSGKISASGAHFQFFLRACLAFTARRSRDIVSFMLFFDRPDGRKVVQTHAMNALMPYMMRGRNNSAVYYQKEIDVEAALRHVRAKNSMPGQTPGVPGDAENRISLFIVLLSALVRTLALRPELNRFVHGRALYQRNHLAISFIVKQRLREESPECNAKVFFEPEDRLDQVAEKVNSAIAGIRVTGEGGDGEKLAKIAHRIPGCKRLIIAVYRLLDRFNLAPAALMKTDPLYTTLYFANLGSIGLDAPFHHLYEWGTASIFVVMGKLIQREPPRGGPARHHVDLRITLDERISDGLYFARSASIFHRMIAHPEYLDLDLESARARLGLADIVSEENGPDQFAETEKKRESV